MNDRGRKRAASGEVAVSELFQSTDSFVPQTSSFSVSFDPLPFLSSFPDCALFDRSISLPESCPLRPAISPSFFGEQFLVPFSTPPSEQRSEEYACRSRSGVPADPNSVVNVCGFEVRMVIQDGRTLYCANDVLVAVGISSVRSTLYKLREKHPALNRVGVLAKLSGSITGQAMTCYPLRICCSECPMVCLYETCQGFKPLEIILSSLGRREFIRLFIDAERMQNFHLPNFIWPTPFWRERIKKAESQRDMKRALNAANRKKGLRDKLLHLADVACLAGDVHRQPHQSMHDLAVLSS